MNRQITGLDNIKVVLFDVDGVILETADIRDQAFVYVFNTIGCRQDDRVMQIHKNNYGVFRIQQFSLIYKEIYGESPDKKLLEKMNQWFTDWVLDQVLSSPLVPGVMQLLTTKSGSINYIVSAAPQDEVRQVIKHHQIDHFFQEIYGGPASKVQIIQSILEEGGWLPDQAMFIGDKISDYKAAAATGVNFIGRVRAEDENPFPKPVRIINDLCSDSFLLQNV